jgi:hypothetical protein
LIDESFPVFERWKMTKGVWPGKVEADEVIISPMDGIIAHLTRKSGDTVAEHGFVRVTGSSVRHNHPDFATKDAADLDSASVFFSELVDRLMEL